jgi:exosortase A
MSAVLARPAPLPSAWRTTGVAIAVALVAVLLLYRDTALAIVAIWERSGTFAHGYAVLPIALWLVWRKRADLLRAVPAPSAVWLLPLAAAGLLWLLGELAIVNAATHLALAALLVSSVAALLGTAAARVVLFPLAFVFFAVPIGEFMMPQMIVWTADFTVWALRLSGIPVFRDGEQLVIPSGQWSVVEACSGIRYLIASVMVGALFAYLNYRSLRRRLLFMGVAIAVPIVANWVRAYLIVMTGHLSDNRLAVGVDHLVYGWVFFGVVVGIMFAIGMRWAEPEEAAADAATARAAPAGDAVPARRGVWPALALVIALVATPSFVLRTLDAGLSTAPPALPTAFAPGGDWAEAQAPFGDWKPAFRGAAADRRFAFARAGAPPVGLYIGYWRHQGADDKLVSSENTIAGSEDERWRRTSQGDLRVETQGGATRLRAETWRGSVFADASLAPRLRTAQVYWINGTVTASAWQAKLWGGLHKLRGRGDDAAVLVFYTPVVDGSDADARLAQAVRAILPPALAMLQRVRDAD